MSNDEKQLDAVFVIMWELAKLDGLPILIGNQPFEPAKLDPNPHCDNERVQVAVFELQSSKQWDEARECLSAGNEKRAREVLIFYHPWFRSMRDVMWEHLLQFVTRDSLRERIRKILRKYTDKFSRLKTDETLRKRAFTELDEKNILVPKRRQKPATSKKPRTWANKYCELKPGTTAYKAVMATLERYFNGYAKKTPAKRNRSILTKSANHKNSAVEK